jgi:hypothetical protein
MTAEVGGQGSDVGNGGEAADSSWLIADRNGLGKAWQNKKSYNTLILLRGRLVSGFQIFVLRAILGAVFAVVISRIFYPDANLIHVAGLGIILVGLAYLAQYLRKRKVK